MKFEKSDNYADNYIIIIIISHSLPDENVIFVIY